MFDQVEIENQVGLQSDLYAIRGDGARLRRLTRGARAADPDVSPDGRVIVCTIQRADRRELATLPVSAGPGRAAYPAPLASEPGVHFTSPRWSPDGRSIAVERVSTASRAEIVLIDPAIGRIVRTAASSSGSRSVEPAWMPDGRLLFSSDRGGDGFRIFVTDVATRATWRLEDTGANASSPEPSRDGQSLVFVGYTADGYDLFSLPLATARWTLVEFGASAPPDSSSDARRLETAPLPASTTPKSYSPLRTIAPRFWTPTIESDRDELVVGAASGSTDALGRHTYLAEAGWAAGRGRPDWQLAYAYDRWRPTFFANVADDTDPWRDGELRTLEANAGLLFPVRRVRWSQSVLGAFHSSVDDFTCTGCGPSGTARAARRAVRGGWLLNTSRSYGYSISREHGWNAAVTTELTRDALGADGNAEGWTIDLRGYLPVVPRHSVIAARIAGALASGDTAVRRRFSASGNGPQTIGFGFDTDAVGLIRGLDEDDVVGSHAAVVNVDYRFPLWRIERGVGSWPAFARVLHGALFVDAGHAWEDRFRRADVRVSVGAELSLDTVVGYVLPVTFTAGAARVSHDRGVVVFGRVGRAF